MTSKIKYWDSHIPPIEQNAKQQLENLAAMPFIHQHVAVMPDCHAGIGCTVGAVVPTIGAIIPACVGVDLGCGMSALMTGLKASDLPDSLASLRYDIESVVPVGKSGHLKIPKGAQTTWNNLLGHDYDAKDLRKIAGNTEPLSQLGTLGGGNHFIELCIDETDSVWIMLHSGSRGIGNKIGQHYISLAREDMRVHFINLPDKDLAYLPEGTDHFNRYVGAVEWAQNYARLNRDVMMLHIVDVMTKHFKPFQFGMAAVSCHHNYISRENHFGKNVWITRKGAVRARKGDLGIIPGSMGTKSYIVRGLGNRDSFDSCSHGAGRVMSRKKAKETITLDDHINATQGVECRKDSGVLDESPGAYKSLDDVMNSQADLCEIVHTLKAVLCVKG